MNILSYKSAAKSALQEIKDFQDGKKKVIRTNRPYLDNIFPVVNGSVITVSAPSGVGKTFEILRILRNVLDENINPSAKNYVSLNISLEMRMFNIVLRALNGKLKKEKIKIVLEKFSNDEIALVKEYQEYISDDRQFIQQDAITPEDLRSGLTEFIEQHKDKESIFIAIDHLALIKGDSKNKAIESAMEIVNELKMKYNNVIFILSSQTNSNINERSADRNRRSQPIQSDLYYSGFTFQISDYVVVLVNPYRLGINEYSKINTELYPNLSKYFLDIDSKGMTSLECYGVVYYHLLKCRESENGFFIDIYAEDINIDNLEDERAKRRGDSCSPTINAPVFLSTEDNTPPF